MGTHFSRRIDEEPLPPRPLVTSIYGEDKPFVVPRPLLLGKAWCVYFPAPVSPMPDGKSLKFVPDFGHLRFIR